MDNSLKGGYPPRRRASHVERYFGRGSHTTPGYDPAQPSGERLQLSGSVTAGGGGGGMAGLDGLELCRAITLLETGIEWVGEIEIASSTLDFGDLPAGCAPGDTIVVEATIVESATVIPAAPGSDGWTSHGTGGHTNGGPGAGVGYRTCSKVLDQGDIDSGSWNFSNTGRIVGSVYRNVLSVIGLVGASVDGGVSTLFEVPAPSFSVTDGTSWLWAGGHTNLALVDSPGTLTRRASVFGPNDGWAVQFDSGGPVTGFAGASEAISASAWQCHAVELVSDGGLVYSDGDVLEEMLGDGTRASRCGHTHHVIRDEAPGVTDDETKGLFDHTYWIDLTNKRAYVLRDQAEGAADWDLVWSLNASDIVILDTANDFTATNVEAALAELQSDAEAHLADTSDAHDASSISILDTANDFTATDVEGALAELQSDAEAHLADTSDAHDASAISILDTANDFTATDVEGALAELQAADEADEAALAAHLADTTDAHDASAISIADAGGDFAATDVEGALAELQQDAEDHLADTADAHDASAISILDTGAYFTATDVEGALAELGAGGGGGSIAVAEADGAPDVAGVTRVEFSGATVTDDGAGQVTVTIAGIDDDVTAHLVDAVDAHDASAISIVDAGGDFTATDVEGALAELQADAEADATALSDHLADATDAHDASAVSLVDSGGYFTATDVEAALQEVGARRTQTINVPFMGGGAVLAVGAYIELQFDFAFEIQAVTLFAAQSGSIVIDIYKDTYANHPPTNADTICASAPPTLSAARKSTDSTLTGWTKSVAAGDILRLEVESVSSITQVTLALKILRG